jgi:hypothetical protein
MSPGAKKWLTGCGIGCGVLVVLAIVGTIGGSLVIMGPFRDAIETREDLDARLGSQDDFTPAASGVIEPARVEAFLTVRAAIQPLCDEFARTNDQFERMDQLEEDASKREAMVGVLGLTREVFGMVPRLGRLYAARNGALAEVEMGLGEYTYLFVLAYLDEIQAFSTTESAFGGKAVNARLHTALRGMLERQLVAVPDDQEHEAWRAELAGEVARLERDPDRLPWQNGLPEPIAASLEPYRDQLAAGFCAEALGLELNRNRTRGLSIHGD